MSSPAPHGGRLLSLKVQEPTKEKVKDLLSAQKVKVSNETLSTIMNLATGVLSPLEGFMGSADYESVLKKMRLVDDTPWTIPVLLHVPEGENFQTGEDVALVDAQGTPVARMPVDESYAIDKKKHVRSVYGTEDTSHPGVTKIFSSSPNVIAGKIEEVLKIDNPYERYTLTPKETRILFKERGWKDVIAFQTRNAPHI